MTATAELERLPGDGLELAVRHRAAVVREGPSRALLMLHGWPGTHRDWGRVFDLIAADHRWNAVTLIAPDLRGYGASDRPALHPLSNEPYAAYTPAAHCADVAALLDHLGIGQVLIAAYDLGANVAQRFARSGAAHVAGLVLCDPVHPAARARASEVDLAAELWYQHLHVQPWAPELIAHNRGTVELYLRHFYTHWWGEGAVDESHFQAVVNEYARDGAFAASISWYRSRAASRAAEAEAARTMPPLSTPTAVLWGEADPVIPLFFAGNVGESFLDYNLQTLPGVGHFVPLEAPDRVANATTALAERLGWL